MITETVKSLLNIKIKARHDSFTDQYNRIFMVKMAMVASMLLGLNWLKDEITCIIPKTTEMDGKGREYVHEACWIQGFYIYKQLLIHPGIRTYFGIPKDLENDGIYPNGILCSTSDGNPKCKPMLKTFYLQYQWFHFYTALIGVFYYAPYVLFRYVNTDMISLKHNLEEVNVDVDEVVNNYFNYEINPPIKMRMRLLGNVCVKLAYIFTNVIVFLTTDALLNGDYRRYGQEWIKWGKQGNQLAFDYTSRHTKYRAGDQLLPTFGICEVLEIAKDLKHELLNKHRFVCEISQNVLYQYVLIVLWFLFVLGMIISCIGFLFEVIGYIVTITCLLTQGKRAKKVYDAVTIRECEYLEFMRKRNLPVYGKVIRKLQKERFEKFSNDNGYIRTGKNNPYEVSQKLLEETVAPL